MGKLEVYGSIENVLFSRVSKENIHERNVAQAGFSFGLGGLDIDYLPGLGELVTCPGTVAVLPADNIKNVSTSNTGSFYTPFNVKLTGIGDKKMVPLALANSSVSAIDIFNNVIQYCRKDGRTSPLFGLTWFGKIEFFRGSFLKKAPILPNSPAGGKPISDAKNHSKWFGVEPTDDRKDLFVLSVGAAIDFSSPAISNLNGLEKNVFYKNPNDPAGSGNNILIHQHAFILEGIPEDGLSMAGKTDPGTVNEAALHWAKAGTIIDAKHILDDSRFTNAFYAFTQYDSIQHFE